jgi:hypothetical protein
LIPWYGGSRTIWSTFPCHRYYKMLLLWLLVVSRAKYLFLDPIGIKMLGCSGWFPWKLPRGIVGSIYKYYPHIKQRIAEFPSVLH